jgi:hypothetical protein
MINGHIHQNINFMSVISLMIKNIHQSVSRSVGRSVSHSVSQSVNVISYHCSDLLVCPL